MELLISQLSSLITSGEVGDTLTWPERIKKDVQRWLSDFHLVSFLCLQGLLSLVSSAPTTDPQCPSLSRRKKKSCFVELLRNTSTQMTLRLSPNSSAQPASKPSSLSPSPPRQHVSLSSRRVGVVDRVAHRSNGFATPFAAFDRMGLDTPTQSRAGAADAASSRCCGRGCRRREDLSSLYVCESRWADGL